MGFFRKKTAQKEVGQLSELGIKNARAQLQLLRALKSLREQHGISVQEVADSMGVDASMVYRFEKGGTNFTMSTLRAYANAVDAKLELGAIPARESLEPGSGINTGHGDSEFRDAWQFESFQRDSRKWNPQALSEANRYEASL